VSRLIDGLERRWRQFDDLRTRVEITLRQDGQAQRLSGVLLLKSPNAIRCEALSPWGQPILMLAATAESFTLYRVTENRALLGPASARATERWLGFALEPVELVGILTGHVLAMKEPRTGTLRLADGMGPSLELTGEGAAQRIWLNLETLVVRQVEWIRGDVRLRVTYDGGGPTDPPTGLILEALDRSFAVSIRYREPEIGVGLPAEIFTLALPQHTEIQRFR
jgi:outer membrane lipoprotein-sorting protein